jgi:hypothetical protein
VVAKVSPSLCRRGDHNTRFFHLVANFKRAKNHILKVVHNGFVVEGLRSSKMQKLATSPTYLEALIDSEMV